MPFRASVASVVVLLLLVGCGSEDEASPGDSTPPTVTEPIQTIATVPETAPAIVTVYFLRDGKVGAASRAVVAGPQIGRAAITNCSKGPSRLRRPPGCERRFPLARMLEGLSISTRPRRGRALEPAGRGGERPGRLYADALPDRADGRPSSTVQPRGRADLEEFAPSVLVESPTLGEHVSVTAPHHRNSQHLRGDVQRRGRGREGPRSRQALRDRDARDPAPEGPSMPKFRSRRPVRAPGSSSSSSFRPRMDRRIHEVEIPLQIAP